MLRRTLAPVWLGYYITIVYAFRLILSSNLVHVWIIKIYKLKFELNMNLQTISLKKYLKSYFSQTKFSSKNILSYIE